MKKQGFFVIGGIELARAPWLHVWFWDKIAPLILSLKKIEHVKQN